MSPNKTRARQSAGDLCKMYQILCHFTHKVPGKKFFGLGSHVFWIQRPQNRCGPHENIFKRLIYRFFLQKMAPGGGAAFYQISPDVAPTTCIQLLLEMTPSIFPFGPIPTVFGFSTPKKQTVLMKTFLKGSFARFFPKKRRPGGPFYHISPGVARTTCIQLLLEMTPAIFPFGPIPTIFRKFYSDFNTVFVPLLLLAAGVGFPAACF